MPATPKNDSPLKPNEASPLHTLATEKDGALDTEDSVKTAGDRMREHDTDKWPVTEARKLVGIVDEKNPDWRMGGHGHDPKDWRVGQIMNREVAFCYEDQDCVTARQLMNERGLAYLPVVDREMRIVGIFSREEIRQKADADEERHSPASDAGAKPETP